MQLVLLVATALHLSPSRFDVSANWSAMKSARGLLINDGDTLFLKSFVVCELNWRGWRTASVAVSSLSLDHTWGTLNSRGYLMNIIGISTEYHWNIYIIIMRELKCDVRIFKISQFWEGKNLCASHLFIPQGKLLIYRILLYKKCASNNL